jgi:1,4-alpha-glucan branching enzyme
MIACGIRTNTLFKVQTTKNVMQPRSTRPGAVARSAAQAAHSDERSARKPVEFRLNLPGVKSATLAGSFNNWYLSRTPLAKDSNGSWKTTVYLAPGRYEYRFVIDGAQWFSDPGAKESVPNGFGSTNSVVVV